VPQAGTAALVWLGPAAESAAAACCSWTQISPLPCGGRAGGTFLVSCPSGLLDRLEDSELQEKGKAAVKASAP